MVKGCVGGDCWEAGNGGRRLEVSGGDGRWWEVVGGGGRLEMMGWEVVSGRRR